MFARVDSGSKTNLAVSSMEFLFYPLSERDIWRSLPNGGRHVAIIPSL